MKDLLYKKFTEVPTRPGRGGTYSYIRWQDVADRMNQIFGINWSSEVVYQDIINSNVIVRVRVTVVDAETNNEFSQEGFGGAPVDDRQEAGNTFKSAYSKALKDACRKWGIGLYLEEDSDEINKQEVAQEISTVPLGIINPGNKFVQENITIPVGVIDVPTNNMPTVPSVPTNSVSSVPTNPVPELPTMPPIPTQQLAVPIVATGLQFNNKTTGVSDVQKAALQSIMNLQGVEYNELVRDAFELNGVEVPNTIPSIDDLSYKDAVIVVKYGNDKFRKR